MMGDVDAEGDMKRLVGIIDSMTARRAAQSVEDRSIKAAAAASRPVPGSNRPRSTNWSSSSTAWPT